MVTNPQVYNIFLGDWTSAANQSRATRLNQFITDLMNSSFMNMLSQYGCGSTGTFIQGVFIANTNNNLLDSELQTFIQTAINNNVLPEPIPNSNIVYIFFLDNNTGVNDGANILCEPSGDNAFGYHSFLHYHRRQFWLLRGRARLDECLFGQPLSWRKPRLLI